MTCSRSSLTIGRPVCAVSIGFAPGRSLEQILSIVDAELSLAAPQPCDIAILPETFLGQNDSSGQSIDGPCVRAFANLARKHHTYIVCPIDRLCNGRRFNSSILLDRCGTVAAIYDKIHPLWWTEGQIEPPVEAARDIVVCETDFGRIGLAICFDVNWPAQWRQMAQAGAELVLWSSAYSGGRPLQAHAIQNNYYILTSTWAPDCRVYDIDGSPLLFDRENRGGGLNVTRVTLDLDRRIFHGDRHQSRLQELMRDFAGQVVVDRRLEEESWFILQAARPGIHVPELAARYGLQELRSYLDEATSQLDRIREAGSAGKAISAFGAAGTARS